MKWRNVFELSMTPLSYLLTLTNLILVFNIKYLNKYPRMFLDRTFEIFVIVNICVFIFPLVSNYQNYRLKNIHLNIFLYTKFLFKIFKNFIIYFRFKKEDYLTLEKFVQM